MRLSVHLPTLAPLAQFVMAGLDPAIHRFRKNPLLKRMDARVKPAHDDG